jgi:SNF2 family DNA or RNA helicase
MEEDRPPARPMLLVLNDLTTLTSPPPTLLYRSPLAVALDYAGGVCSLQRYQSLKRITPLWSFQQEAVAFAKRRESDADGIGCRGMLLCDEQGMGKTSDILTVILEQNQEASKKSGRRFNGATLVICTRILIQNWLAEVAKFPAGSLAYFVLGARNQPHTAFHYHHCCDIVFATYSSVASTYKRRSAGNLKYDVLFGQVWRRLAADEAQSCVVKEREISLAVGALRAESKYMISGTPAQNRTSDLFTLMRLIDVPRGANLLAIRDKVMLYRRMSDVDSTMLAPKCITRRVQLVSFRSLPERLLYYLYALYAKEKNVGGQGHTIDVIQRMRQLCITPALVKNLFLPRGMLACGGSARNVAASEEDKRTVTAMRLRYKEGEGYAGGETRSTSRELELEWSPFNSPHFSLEQEEDCKQYASLHQELTSTPHQWTLARDHSPPSLKKVAMVSHILDRTLRLDMPSSKEAEIVRYVAQVPRDDKVIIYSNYVGVLTSLDRWLQRTGLTTVVVTSKTGLADGPRCAGASGHGGVGPRGAGGSGTRRNGTREAANDARLESFTNDPTIKVLLITLKLGNAGLTLDVANHVLFCDPWWNPFVLEQGEKRMRSGRGKALFITYFVMDQTLEVYMLNHTLRKKRQLTAFVTGGALEEEQEEEEDLFASLSTTEKSLLFDYTITVDPLIT